MATELALKPEKHGMMAMTIAAIGIVYGDIGTSPLYTMKAVFIEEHGLALIPENIIGVISLIIWGLIAVVSLKYVYMMLKADNRGEGGILALVALAHNALPLKSKWHVPLLMMGVFGAALFYGDSVITPAISVLSATEGLEVATLFFKPYIVPIAIAILVVLYAIQSTGTAGIGKWVGPLMIIWFLTLAVMGIVNIIEAPQILVALNPLHAWTFMHENAAIAFIALGAIVLAFTGAEALYADMGHFGSGPIRRAWFMLVFPALSLNYLGQGGLLLSNPAAISNPFFQQLGSWSIYPLVFISTIAVVVASQATISGAFSITRQAIGLGLLPRMKIVHTSASEIGQIYMPTVNWLQMAAVLLAIVGFGSSDNLAGAYGIAVTGTMTITTILLFFVMYYHWKLNILVSLMVASCFFVIDIFLFSSNVLKITSGGWFPLVLGIMLYILMLTWRRGRKLVGASQKRHAIPLESFLESLFFSPPQRVKGTAVFLRGESDGVPQALLHNLSHNKVLHERVFFLTIHIREVPWVPRWERIQIHELGHQCYQIDVYYGFKNEPDIPKVLELCQEHGYSFDMMSTSFFVSRQTLIPSPKSGMVKWREHLFIWISRNARSAADYYQIPTNRVIELGARVEI